MRTIKAFCVFAILCSIGAASLFAYEEILKKRAGVLIGNTYDLSNWTGKPLPLAALKSRFQGRLKPLPDCTSSRCGYEVRLSNRLLAVLKIAPYAELTAEYWVRDGSVESGMLSYTATDRSGRTIVVHSEVNFNEGVMFSLHPWEDSSSLDTNGLVSVSSGNSQAERQSALALNLSCMTQLRGCSSVAELLPTIWERGPKATIRGRLPNHEGFIDAPGWINP